jgi:formylglycine-generating enzyme required for sulfatase activity
MQTRIRRCSGSSTLSGRWLAVLVILALTQMIGATGRDPSPQERDKRSSVINSIGIKLISVPAGRFAMGSPVAEEGHELSEPEHNVRITKPFFIGATVVTEGQWSRVMGNKSSGKEDYPAGSHSWSDAVKFCQRLSEIEKKRYRLPTEAEWEYACRAGSTGAYGGSGKLDEMGWYDKNSDHEIHAVALKSANSWGLYDMHGNVWEWCSDYYGAYDKGDVEDPTGPAAGGKQPFRVIRGGSCTSPPGQCRGAYRFDVPPVAAMQNIGFRICLEE